MAVFNAYQPSSAFRRRNLPPMSGIVLIIYLAIFCLLCSAANYLLSSFLASIGFYPGRNNHEIVVATMGSEDVSWMYEYLPDWKKNVYVVDNPNAELTVPKNKGRESMVYLTYIIDHYDRLPQHILFIHPQRYQWHNDDPLYDNVPLIKSLQLPFLSEQGYLNLRCVWSLGCPIELRPFTDTQRPDVHAGSYFKAGFEELFPGSPVPTEVGVSCCAQFGVTREQIHKRPKWEYEHFRQWLLDTPLPDELSGRIFEYSWHMIFGRNSVHCPVASECYCKQYGMCNLTCRDTGTCEGRYAMPPYSTLPQGWPDFGYDGKPRLGPPPPVLDMQKREKEAAEKKQKKEEEERKKMEERRQQQQQQGVNEKQQQPDPPHRPGQQKQEQQQPVG
ncbi:hypothetical protein AJ79_07204 [Helicocarpus griseus UAMH5409]|uniref:Uncharacterized protein n=1 Tax=Helicocarpus griseus UAMH5409 TaxID=1447875 RepID=A0A2B7X5G1_9EURO|nr:hypothetical protein AJ79_07204 [Helicocarpus griseus UAMH5409]